MSIYPTPVYRQLAGKVLALSNCITSGNTEWRHRHEADIEEIVKQFMPSGSGIDCGTKLDIEDALRHPGARLLFSAPFHHMNEGGMYDGWTDHDFIVTPSLWHEIDLRITGRDRNDIKEYLHEVFHTALMQPIYQTADGDWHLHSEPVLVQPK
jgi:hypothetical protein